MPENAAAAPPALIGVAHGTRDPRGAATVRALLHRVGTLRPELTVRSAFLELAEPSLPAVLAELAGTAPAGAVVVAPLLLGPGYHSTVDIPAAAGGRLVARVLGPDPLLAEALHDRLSEAGWRPEDPVVLAAAGSGDPAATAVAEEQARLLAARLGVRVTAAYASAGRPDVRTAVAGARHGGGGHGGSGSRVAVATYLLAPGFFADRVAEAVAHIVSAPLGAHPAVARLVLARYDAAVAAGAG